jgi:ABC-type uncharacterized transport system substrate-binding protein
VNLTVSRLPVQQMTRSELVVNINAANAIGVTTPKSVLQRADKVVNCWRRVSCERQQSV